MRSKLSYLILTIIFVQMNACHKIMNIPLTDMCELTGHTAVKQIVGVYLLVLTGVFTLSKIFVFYELFQAVKRRNLYMEKRVFFATPQTIDSDIQNGGLDISNVVWCVC